MWSGGDRNPGLGELHGTWVMHADWTGDGITDECIGIAPNRTIWHAWRTSQQWEQLGRPSARADCTQSWIANPDLSRREVNVTVFDKGTWTNFDPANGWGDWHKTSDAVACY